VTTLPDSEREDLMAMAPMPLNGPADPVAVAHAAVQLGSAEHTHMTGQIVCVDGASTRSGGATPSGDRVARQNPLDRDPGVNQLASRSTSR